MTRLSLASLAAASCLALTAALPARAADKVVYQLDWLPGGDKAPIYICVEQGFCAEAGLEIDIVSGRGSTDAITRLTAGASDIGVADLGALLAARAREKVAVTAVMSIFNKGPHAFYVPAGSGVETVADLKGKTIATSPFTSSNVFLPLVLAEAGLGEDDITLIKADPGALGPMLVNGNTDAIIAWMTDLTRYSGQAAEAGETLTALPWSAAGLELYSAALIANDSFLAERPDVARRFVAAYAKSIEFERDHPGEAAAAVQAIVPELAAENVEGSVHDTLPLIFNDVTERDGLGVFDADRLAETWARVSAAQELDPASLDPETVVDRSFAPAK